MFGDFGFAARGHVLGPSLFVCVFGLTVFDHHGETRRVYVGEFRAVSVAAAHESLLGIVVVGTREKVAENKFGVPNTFFLVHLDGNSTEGAVIFDRHGSSLFVDGYADGGHSLRVERVSVDGVDQYLIEDFQKGGAVFQGFLLETCSV